MREQPLLLEKSVDLKTWTILAEFDSNDPQLTVPRSDTAEYYRVRTAPVN